MSNPIKKPKIKSSLFRANRTGPGKGWWDRIRGLSFEKLRSTFDRVFGEKDPKEYQTGKVFRKTYGSE